MPVRARTTKLEIQGKREPNITRFQQSTKEHQHLLYGRQNKKPTPRVIEQNSEQERR